MSYYNLPGISCDNRLNVLTDIFTTNEERCENLNPDEIYSSLFPNYIDKDNLYTSTTGQGTDNISNTYGIDTDKCAYDCIDNTTKQCNYFSYDKPTNNCKLYSSNNFTTISPSRTNSISSYEKKTDTTCTDCISNNQNIDDSFTFVGDNMSKSSDQISDTSTNDLDECKLSCYNNNNCNGFSYIQNYSKCSLYENSDASTDNNNLYKINTNSNNSKIDDSYESYYRNYDLQKDGDYYCSYNNDSGTCSVSSLNTCSGQVSYDNDNEEEGNNSDVTPSVTIPSVTNVKNKFKLNGVGFSDCIKNGNEQCADILYTVDNDGFPQLNRYPNPPINNKMVTNVFRKYKNSRILNCPSGYIPGPNGADYCINSNSDKCTPNNIINDDSSNPNCTYSTNSLMKNSPQTNVYSDPLICKDWCLKNKDCYAVSTNNDNFSGKNSCYYYNNSLNNKKFKQKSDYNNFYVKKNENDRYVYDIKTYTNNLISNQTPLKANIAQILYNDEEESVAPYTKCMKISDISNNFNNALISITKQCVNDHGPGYIGNVNSLNYKKKCNNVKSQSFRYPCQFNPTNNTNLFNYNFNSNIETFKNRFSIYSNNKILLIYFCITIFLLIFVFL